MKVNKIVNIPARVETLLDYVQCELCERKTHRMRDWSTEGYEVNEVDVSATKGTNYPEGGCRKTLYLDICPDCFHKKLIPWFKAAGGTVREEESDW